MKSVEESVVIAMDGSDRELFHFLPYILQDTWEIGSNPDILIKIIKKYFHNLGEIKILDLGCGKGAVSVNISKDCGCFCHGIDAIPEFIEFAEQKAVEFKVNHLCKFEIGDIRDRINDISDYDVIILGSIGPVLGDYYSTLKSLSRCLSKNGLIIIDDGFIEDDSDFNHPLMYKKTDILHQIEMAGMQILEMEITDKNYIKDSNNLIYENLKKRCNELIGMYPDKKSLFLDYIGNQEIENDVLENKIIETTMVIKRK